MITRTSLVICILSLLFFSIVPAHAKPNPPTFPTTYDGTPPGAEPLAMGYAFCAVGGSPEAGFYNPAGLATIGKQYFSVTYEAARQSQLTPDEIFKSEMLNQGRNITFIGLTSQSGAVYWRPLSDRTFHTQDGANWKDTEIKINAYTLSACHAYNSKFTSGINLSYLSGRISESSITNGTPLTNLADGNGVSMDMGFLYKLAPEFNLGLSLENIAAFMWWDDFEAEQLPFTVRAGFAFQIASFLTFASDMERHYYRNDDADSKNITHFGLEQSLGSVLHLRAGIYGPDLQDNETTHVTAGLGYQQNNFSLSLSGEKYRVEMTDVFRYVFSLNLPL